MNTENDRPSGPGWKHCAIVLSLPWLVAACAKQPREVVESPVPVKTFQIGSEATQSTDQFPVTIVRDRESNVSFRVGGVIQTLNVRAGQIVQSGQALAALKDTPFTSGRTRAAADVNRLQNAARRNEALLPAGAVSTGTKEDTDDALAAAKAALSTAQYDEDSTTLKAPFAGIVLSRDAEVGETVVPGQRVVRIADLGSTVVAKASVPARLAQSLHVGDGATVWVGDASLAASIRFIGALSDPKTGAVTVDLVVRHGESIASGSTGAVEFRQRSGGKPAESVLLPPEALLETKAGEGTVYVLDAANSVARRKGIKVMGFEGEMLRIAGLARGVKVLTTGAGFVSDGQKVREVLP